LVCLRAIAHYIDLRSSILIHGEFGTKLQFRSSRMVFSWPMWTKPRDAWPHDSPEMHIGRDANEREYDGLVIH
jgi:hypothetical protein